MKNRGLIVLLVASFLSCSTLTDVVQQKYNSPEKILIGVSNEEIFLIEDTDGDGKLDAVFKYKIIAEEKPDYISGDTRDFYFLERKSVGTLDSLPPLNYSLAPLNKDEIPIPIIPDKKTKPFDNNLKRDAKFVY
jgi:hypothetical protein